MEEKIVPREVKAIGILYIIGGIVALILGIIPLILFFNNYNSAEAEFPADVFKITLTIMLLIVAIGFLVIFIGRGLWKGRRWAKRFAIVFSLVALLQVIATIKIGTFNYKILISGFINLYIACYLIFNKKVKEAFSS